MKIFLGFIGIFFSVNALAFDIKGVNIGETINPEDIEKLLGIECFSASTGIICNGSGTLLGHKADITVTTSPHFVVGTIYIKFNNNDYLDIRDSLKNKFGKPSGTSTSVLSNAMGAKFKQETVTWIDKRKGETAMIEKYSQSIDNGTLYIYSKEGDESVKRSIEKNKSDI